MATASLGLPNTYLGTTHAPERVDSTTSLPSVFCDSSLVMSAALLPMPTTRIRLSRRCSGSVGERYACEWIDSPLNSPGKSGSRGSQWCPLPTTSAS